MLFRNDVIHFIVRKDSQQNNSHLGVTKDSPPKASTASFKHTVIRSIKFDLFNIHTLQHLLASMETYLVTKLTSHQ